MFSYSFENYGTYANTPWQNQRVWHFTVGGRTFHVSPRTPGFENAKRAFVSQAASEGIYGKLNQRVSVKLLG